MRACCRSMRGRCRSMRGRCRSTRASSENHKRRSETAGLGRGSESAAALSLAPEELPRVVLEVADELLQIVVDLFVHQQRADRAAAFANVLHDAFRFFHRAL